MKESDVTGLVELRQEYEGKLRALPGYEDLETELKTRALDLMRQEMQRKGLAIKETSLPHPDLRTSCGFCTACVSACTSCVFHAAQ